MLYRATERPHHLASGTSYISMRALTCLQTFAMDRAHNNESYWCAGTCSFHVAVPGFRPTVLHGTTVY